MKIENITKNEKDLFLRGYTVHEYYKNYGVASYYLASNIFYAITKSNCLLYDNFLTKQGAKTFITKMIKKGEL